MSRGGVTAPTELLGQPVRQIAYFVHDVREAALRHAALFGSGPFFVLDEIRPACVHRGVARAFDIAIAIGQWGGQMIEFVQQNNPGPSIFRDIYPEGSDRYGFHHVALIVNDLSAAVAAVENAGYPVAARFSPEPGYDVVFADATPTMGHMIELYAAIPPVVGLYAFVAAAAADFDGSEPLRRLVAS